MNSTGGDSEATLSGEIIAICERYRNDDFYISPNIPEDKLANLSRTANAPIDAEVYALIDTTVFGSAKNGMLITSKGLYIHNDKNLDNDTTPGCLFLSWEAFQKTQNSIYPSRLSSIGAVALTDLVNFEFSGCIMNKGDIISMLKEFRACFGRLKEAQVPQISTTSSFLRVQKCTYCSGAVPHGHATCPFCGAPAS